MCNKFVAAAVGALALVCHLASNAVAQTFPSRPITLVVPYPAGGGADIIGRMLAESMKPLLGQPIAVVNRPGGQGTIGTAEVIRSAPDGYNLVLSAVATLTVQPHRQDLPYNTPDDYDPDHQGGQPSHGPCGPVQRPVEERQGGDGFRARQSGQSPRRHTRQWFDRPPDRGQRQQQGRPETGACAVCQRRRIDSVDARRAHRGGGRASVGIAAAYKCEDGQGARDLRGHAQRLLPRCADVQGAWATTSRWACTTP